MKETEIVDGKVGRFISQEFSALHDRPPSIYIYIFFLIQRNETQWRRHHSEYRPRNSVETLFFLSRYWYNTRVVNDEVFWSTATVPQNDFIVAFILCFSRTFEISYLYISLLHPLEVPFPNTGSSMAQDL